MARHDRRRPGASRVSESPNPPARLPVKPQWFCGQHGQTNSVLGLRNRAYCLDCVIEVVERAVHPAFRTTDFVPQ